MSAILRNPEAAVQSEYDLIIIGGGIYGAMLALESGFRGLRSLLLEKDDFGGATSYNSLRIVHGGFRYLQSLDLRRFYESVGERRWFLKTFPELVKPLPCLMPLYGKGTRRPGVLASALRANDLLSVRRNVGVRGDRALNEGKIISSKEVRSRFPQVDTAGLQGGAVWFDASMSDSQRVLMSVLRWAVELGSKPLNYVTAEEILTADDRVVGVQGRDGVSGKSYEYKASVVVNAGGAWVNEIASSTDIMHPSLAWNLLFDRPALSDYALAIAPKQPDAQTYFLHPWKNRLLAGTLHHPWQKSADTRPQPSTEQIEDFVENLNRAVPNLNLRSSEVIRVLAGVLPVKQAGGTKLSSREVIFDHGKRGGAKGSYSVAGVKFTTSRLVADRTLRQIFPARKRQESELESNFTQGQYDYDWWPLEDQSWLLPLRDIIANESVIHLDDLLFRRTSLADNPRRGMACSQPLSRLMAEMLNWNEQRRCAELARLVDCFKAG